MNSFKISKKTVYSDNRTSILQKHDEKLKKIEEEKLKLSKFKTELAKYKKLLNLSKDKDQISNINNKIKDLELKISNIENESELCDYLFNVMDFINTEEDVFEDKNSGNENGEIYKYINVEEENMKGTLYKKFINKCFPGEIDYYDFRNKTNINLCDYCNGSLISDEKCGYVICTDCGITEKRNINRQPEWNFSESHEFVKPYTYKRPNHFKEWLTQVQGLSRCTIPKEMIDLIFSEIISQKLNNKKLITYDKVKDILRKLKLNKYYEQIPTIIHEITGNKQLELDSKLEQQLIKMFDDIQEPFQKHCPKNRKNFLSYSYTIHKFLQLLDKNEFLIYFPLLKSRQKLFEQEDIWKNICKELNWKFIPSI